MFFYQLEADIEKNFEILNRKVDGLVLEIGELSLKRIIFENENDLQDVIEAWTDYCNSTKKKRDVDLKEAISNSFVSNFQNSWTELATCLSPQSGSGCQNGIKTILNWSKKSGDHILSWDRPLVFVSYASYYYQLLWRSYVSLYGCAKVLNRPFTLRVTDMIPMAQAIHDSISQMKPFPMQNHLPPVVSGIVSMYPNKGEAGAQNITQKLKYELDNFYFASGLQDVFNIDSAFVAIYASADHYTPPNLPSNYGYKFNYHGYDIFFAFLDESESSKRAIHVDSSCTQGSSEVQYECVTKKWPQLNMVWTSTSTFFSYYSFNGKFTVLQNKQALSPAVLSNGHTSNRALSRIIARTNIVRQPTMGLVEVGDQDLVGTMEKLSAVFDTVGAVAEFFGPAGASIIFTLNLANKFMSIIGFLASSDVDPITEKVKEIQREIDGCFAQSDEKIDQAVKTLEIDFTKTQLYKASADLKQACDHWVSYRNGTWTKTQFVRTMKPSMPTYIKAFSLVRNCLDGTMPSCAPVDSTVLKVFLNNGKTWMRPRMFFESVRYYYLLLTNSAMAICGYDNVARGLNYCSIENRIRRMSNFAAAIQKQQADIKEMFKASIGPNKLPPLIDHVIRANAESGLHGAAKITQTVKSELDTYYFADGLDKFFEVNTSLLVVYSPVSGSSNHFMSSGPSKYTFDCMFDISIYLHSLLCVVDELKHRERSKTILAIMFSIPF